MVWRVLILLGVLPVSGVASADPRPFTFTEDTYPEGKGNFEYEQYVSWRHDSGFDRFSFRHEFEYGVADNFDISIYVASWSYEDSNDRQGTKFDSSSIE